MDYHTTLYRLDIPASSSKVPDQLHSLTPAADLQEERQEFDTHAVGAELLKRMQDLSMAEESHLQTAPEPQQVVACLTHHALKVAPDLQGSSQPLKARASSFREVVNRSTPPMDQLGSPSVSRPGKHAVKQCQVMGDCQTHPH